VNVSRPCAEVIKPGRETSLEWTITLQGQVSLLSLGKSHYTLT